MWKQSWGNNTFIGQIDFKTKTQKDTKKEEGYYTILKKKTIQQKDVTIVNMHPTWKYPNT